MVKTIACFNNYETFFKKNLRVACHCFVIKTNGFAEAKEN